MLNFYDPKVNRKEILKEFNENIIENNVLVSDSALKAAQQADAILVLTEWEEFRSLNWKNIFEVMRKPAWVFDSRICLEKEKLKAIGFKVWTLGTT